MRIDSAERFAFSFIYRNTHFCPNRLIRRTQRKVPVRLCSITEPIKQQSDRLGWIDFWLGSVRLTTPGLCNSDVHYIFFSKSLPFLCECLHRNQLILLNIYLKSNNMK